MENTDKKRKEREEKEKAFERDQLLLKFTKNYHAVSKLILAGKRTELEIESLLVAGQCVISDEFCKVQAISNIKELLLSDDRRMVQFGWRRLFKMTELPVQVPRCPSWWTTEFLTRNASLGNYPIYLPSQYIGVNPTKDLYKAGKNPHHPAFPLFSLSYRDYQRDANFPRNCRAPLTGWVLAASSPKAFQNDADLPSGYTVMYYEQFLFLHRFMVEIGYWDKMIAGEGLLQGESRDGKPLKIRFDKDHVSETTNSGDNYKWEYYLVNSRY